MTMRFNPDDSSSGSPSIGLMDFMGQGFFQSLLGGKPHTTIGLGETDGGPALVVQHPIFGDIDAFSLDSDEARAAAALLGELGMAHMAAVQVYREAVDEFDDGEAERIAKKTLSILRGQDPESPDVSHLDALKQAGLTLGDVIEVLAGVFCLMYRDLVAGAVFDQVVQKLDVESLLGHPIEPVSASFD